MELLRPDKRAELMKMSKEEIIDYMEVCNKNFWSLQNNWMANVTMKYGSEVAAEFDEIAVLEIRFDVFSHRQLNVVDDTHQIASGRVTLNHDASLDVFAIDGIRTLRGLHVRNRTQGYA